MTMTHEKKKAMQLIAKLLAKAEDSAAAPAEAKLFKDKALALMEQHMVTRDQVTNEVTLESRMYSTRWNTIPRWAIGFAYDIGEFCGVYPTWVQQVYSTSKAWFWISGIPSDLDTWEYLWETLLSQLETDAKVWRRNEVKRREDEGLSKMNRGHGMAYRKGWTHAAAHNMKDFSKTLYQDTRVTAGAVVPMDRYDQAKVWFNDNNKVTTGSAVSRAGTREARMAGAQDGSNASVTGALSSSPKVDKTRRLK